ncbi:MAG: carbon storage regulator [Zetaproteobacteria bacterium CG2_30_46_52]|nr:MAG: carbon storage regulator [Zetaproteobacteria bacterium CG2_30_46_52]
MMVFRQKIGDVIRISDDIRLIIHDIQDGRIVRFGIEAPAEIPVHRLEIYELIQQENQAAVAGDAMAWLNQGGHDASR